MLSDDDAVMLHCTHMLSFMLILCLCYSDVLFIVCWCYDYATFISYIWIDKIYDIDDDVTLTQIVLHCTIGVSTEDEDAEDDEENESDKDNIIGKRTSTR